MPGNTSPPFIGTTADASEQMPRGPGRPQGRPTTTSDSAKDARVAAHGAIMQEANRGRWDTIGAPIARAVPRLEPRPARDSAGADASQLDLRARSIDDDLEDLNRHRIMLVDKLVALCRTQRRMLKEVHRSSELPHSLGELSGMKSFKIEFDPLPEDQARAKLAARVDQWATAGPVEPTERTDRLAEALTDTVRHRERKGPWTIEVLKPSVDFTPVYRSPERIDIEFSGGQELTLAVLLYLTLSKVRARDPRFGGAPTHAAGVGQPLRVGVEPRAHRDPTGTRGARSDIQLVCATGIADPAVVTAFEGHEGRIVMLRNDKDQRRALRYLRIDDPETRAAVVSVLDGGHDHDDPQSYLSSTSYRVDLSLVPDTAEAPA